MAELIVFSNGAEESRHPLVKDELTIGRLDTNDVVINSGKASRRHARIIRSATGFAIEDLGSTAGLMFQGRLIRGRDLCDGDRLEIGEHDLVFVTQAGAVGTPRATTLQSSRADEWLKSVLISPRASERLQALFEISKTLGNASDFKEVLVQIMDKAIAIMGGERGFLMLRGDDGELKVYVARNQNGDITGVEREKVSRGLMQRVVETRAPLVTMDAANENWATESVLMNSIHAAICAPLLTRDTVSGVIYVDHRGRSNVFSDDDLSFFTTFSLQAKAAIDSSRAYWELVESLFRASDDFIVVCSVERQILRANRAAGTLVGLDADAIVTKRLEDLVISADEQLAVQVCEETIRSGVVSGRELRLRSAVGETPLSVSSFAMHDQVGNSVGLCLIGRDLSEVKRLIGELRGVNQTLEIRNVFIKKTFGRYLSDEVVASLLESPQGLDLGGAKRHVTILMSDLRGFTSMAERLPAEQVVMVLNHYLGKMVDVITRHRGTIDEFIGDAILVIFGAPESRPDDALRAAACAVEMQLEMVAVNRWNAEHDLPMLDMGIALNTGDVVVGNIGSQKRSKYAVVGRQVNLTARVEANTVGGQILVTQGTCDAAGKALVIGRRLDLNVKGVTGTLAAYDLRGVGEPFHVMLEEVEERLLDLVAPIAVRFTVLEGKQLAGMEREGSVARVGTNTADLRSECEPEPLTDLKLVFTLEGTSHDVYAKVVEAPQEPFVTRIHFTSVPPEVRKILKDRPRRRLAEPPS